MKDELFKKLCRKGETADRKLLSEDPKRAYEEYEEILEKMLELKEVDTFLMSKTVLSMMLALIRLETYAEAHALWAAGEDDIRSIGIKSIEDGGVSESDTILYLQISAFLHSLSSGTKKQIVTAIDDTCKQVCEYLLEQDPKMLPSAIRNWRLHLMEVYDGPIPEQSQKQLLSFEKKVKSKDESSSLRFLEPSEWKITWEDEE